MPTEAPQDLIYDIIVEQFNGNRPARIFIQFTRETPTRVARNIIDIYDAINNEPITIDTNQLDRIDEAINMLIWAAKNDPDPVNPELLSILKTII